MPSPRIAICTITARRDARLHDMAKTLTYAARAARGRASLVWVVVDELHGEDRLPASVFEDLEVFHVRPKPSSFRPDLPDHNGARNTALAHALSAHVDYIVYLDDRTVVTRSFADVVLACVRDATGYRATVKFVRDVAVPDNGLIDAHELGGLDFAPCAATTVAGGCFGAPAHAFEQIDGFDEAFSGQYGKEDLEAFVRLERIGIRWMATKRAVALQLGASAPASPAGTDTTRVDITTDREALRGRRNLVLFKKLIADRKRVRPTGDGLTAARAVLEMSGDQKPAIVVESNEIFSDDDFSAFDSFGDA